MQQLIHFTLLTQGNSCYYSISMLRDHDMEPFNFCTNEACANKRRQGLKQETTKGWFVTWFLILLRAEFFIPSLLCLLTRLFIILWTFSIMLASRSSSLRVISSSRASWNPTVLASNYTHNKHTGTCEPSVVKVIKHEDLGLIWCPW